jgi:CheY-like chemotaxis protein
MATGVILHVDDDTSLLRAMATLMTSAGYSVGSARSGPEALRLARQGLQPDVLIVDFNLDADMNGAETAELLRDTLRYAPPVIMLTGDPSNAEFPWIVDVPIWLARKPISSRLLLAALPALVLLSRSVRDLTAMPPRGALTRGLI